MIKNTNLVHRAMRIPASDVLRLFEVNLRVAEFESDLNTGGPYENLILCAEIKMSTHGLEKLTVTASQKQTNCYETFFKLCYF